LSGKSGELLERCHSSVRKRFDCFNRATCDTV
jgi:hypothetical protein